MARVRQLNAKNDALRLLDFLNYWMELLLPYACKIHDMNKTKQVIAAT
jgi:hypothetical protein